MKLFYPFWLLFFLLTMLSCTSAGQSAPLPEPEDNSLPQLYQLQQALRQERAMTIVYGSQQDQVAKAYQDLFRDAPQNARYIKIEVKSDQEITEQDLREKILYLVGTPQSNQILAQLAPQLPIQFGDQQFRFADEDFKGAQSLLNLAYYPNPENPKLPINLLTGIDDEHIIQHLKKQAASGNNRLRLRWSYQIFQNQQSVLLGNFSESGWTFDRKVHYDFRRQDTLATSPHFHFVAHQDIDPDFDMQALVDRCEKTYQQILQFTQQSALPKRIVYHIYATAEYKGLMHNNTEQAHYDLEENAVHTVINEAFANNFIEKENTLLLHQLLGRPKTQALLDGLATCFTKQWQKRGYLYWAARLHQSDNTLSLRELVDPDAYEKASWLVKSCLAGVLVDFLVETYGATTFLAQYTNWQADASSLSNLEKPWQDYLDRLSQTELSKAEPIAYNTNFPYLKGFNFAHEGYSIYNGYISQQAAGMLEKLAKIGTNAVTIIPYSYMRDPQKATPIPFIKSAGSENDESVIHAAFSARQLGMTTLLKPQVWLNGSWPGDVQMNSEEEWQQFFDYYYRWIRHFSLLAEIHQIDIFCIGVEFAKATLSHEQNWRTIVQKVRGLYSGRLTYCANWGDEFEKLSFWDELDYIGLSCYYPLSYSNEASKKELQKGFDKALSKIKSVQKKHNKPVLFTEIGFRSVNQPWKEPHAEANGRAPNEVHQKHCYEVVFEALQDQEWCEGIFWWKWPSYQNYHYKQGYTPNGKSAERVVEYWFKRMY